MKLLYVLFRLILILFLKIYKIKNKLLKPNEIYIIISLFNNQYFTIKKHDLILSNKQTNFRFISIKDNSYFIESRFNEKRLGIDEQNNIKIYSKKENINNIKLKWVLIKISDNEYLIQNEFNKNHIEINKDNLHCLNKAYICPSNNCINKIINNNFKFNLLKLFEENIFKNQYLKFIKNEPIDVVIKYIDLTDKELNRIGINQIYKDKDNEELKYSLRSIFKYIPWIRNIYILMPNKKVTFFKSQEEIREKIIYINDKDFLGFNSANIFAFSFNLFRLEKFGVTKNFIYMEDDFFIGKSLKKTDFFYYDYKEKKILPFLLTYYFNKMNKSDVLSNYKNMFKIRNTFHPHSREGWWFSTYSTEKYFIDNFKNTNLINTNFTHNAIAKNIYELKEIFKIIQNYEYINETLFSKERNILTLNQPHFYNLYQLNIKHKKVHSIPYKYFQMEKINKIKLNSPLFVINTGGNHIPLNRQYKIQQKSMEKIFPFPVKYELINSTKKEDNFNIKIFIHILKLSILFSFLKLYS